MPSQRKRALSVSRSQDILSQAGVSKKSKQSITDGCVLCEVVTNKQNSICCSICTLRFHDTCCGLSDALENSVRSAIVSIGWVCPTCQDGARTGFDKLRAELSSLSLIVRSLQVRLEANEKSVSNSNAIIDKASTHDGVSSDYGEGNDPVSSGILSGPSSSQWSTVAKKTKGKSGNQTNRHDDVTTDDNGMHDTIGIPSITTLIEKTVKSLNRKKLNVVASGLAEKGSEKEDLTLFSSLCTNFLKITPRAVRCTRLSKANKSGTRPRLLLVTFSSETEVSEIIRSAKLLRDSDNETVRTTVFINRDMTKEESNTAYIKRKARRERSTLSAGAPSFVPRAGPNNASQDSLHPTSSMDVVDIHAPSPATGQTRAPPGVGTDHDVLTSASNDGLDSGRQVNG